MISPCGIASHPRSSVRPGPPRRADRVELGLRREALGEGIRRERGIQHPALPHRAPPLPVGGVVEVPDGDGGRDILEAGVERPRLQSAARRRVLPRCCGARARRDRARGSGPAALAARTCPRSRRRGQRRCRRASRRGAIHEEPALDRRGAGGSGARARCRRCRRRRGAAYASPTTNSAGEPSARAFSMTSAAASSPTTRPGARRSANSAVIVPGPQPTSSRASPGPRCGSRYAAEFAIVRQVCDFSTLSWWPCV